MIHEIRGEGKAARAFNRVTACIVLWLGLMCICLVSIAVPRASGWSAVAAFVSFVGFGGFAIWLAVNVIEANAEGIAP